MYEEHDSYAIIYEDKDGYWDEMELHLCGKYSLDDFMKRARQMKEEGHRNVRVVEYVIVEREVMRP